MKWLIRHRAPAYLLIDIIAFQLAFFIAFVFRFESGAFINPMKPGMILQVRTAIALTLFWLVVFGFRGMYREQLSTSRYEAFAETVKSVFIGMIVIMIIFTDPGDIAAPSRLVQLSYGLLVLVFSGGGRAAFRTMIRGRFRRGVGQFRAVLVGFGKRGRKLYRTLLSTPEFGYRVIAIAPADEGEDEKTPEAIPTVPLDQLEEFVRPESGNDVEVVLISMEPANRKKVLDLIYSVGNYPVRMMIIPDFFQILVGLARSQQLYGVPLMEVFPHVMSPFTKFVKRLMDIVISALVLIIGLPLFIIVALLVMLTSPGGAFYRQKRVGYRGREFWMYKFRSMVRDAEKQTGAVWAMERDPRITPVGRLLRRTRIDELPQFWNVLRGDMSLVGPRPERKIFVEELNRMVPFYNRRYNVKPGITGWAQIQCKYDTSIEDVREKLQYDLFYIENASIGLDIKILLNTIWVMISFKGQ